MIRCACLGVLLAALAVGTSADPAPKAAANEVTWSDTFPGSDLKKYETDGAIKLDKTAGVVFGPGEAFLGREARMGFDADFRLEARLPKAKARGVSLIVGQRWQSIFGIRLQVADGKPSLTVSLPPEGPVPLPLVKGGAEEGPWVVAANIRYGVVRAKAWRKGDTEPPQWQVTRLIPDTGWEPRAVVVQTDEGEEVAVLALSVRGTKPATKQFHQPLVKLLTQPDATLVAMSETTVLFSQGRNDRAIQKARDALKLSSAAYGPDDALTAACWNNLGTLLNDTDAPKDALEAFKKSHAIRTKALPADHPHIGTALNNLGTGHLGLKQYDESEKWYREALAFRKKVLGDHPDTAFTWGALGNALAYKRQYADAVEYTREALRIYRAVLGDRHPDTVKMRSALAYRLFTAGDFPAARTEYEGVLDTTRDLSGPKHPATAAAAADVAAALKGMGLYEEARRHLETALDIYTKGGAAHRLARADVLNQLAIGYADTGDDITARKLLEEAVAIRKLEHGADHPDVAVLEINLATILWTSGDADRALRMFRAALHVLQTKLPPDDLRIGLALNAALMFGVGASDEEVREVLELAEKSLTIKAKVLGPTHPVTLESLNTFATLTLVAGQPIKAEKLLTEALAECAKKLGEDHPLTCVVRHNLALVYYRLVRLPEALGHCRTAVAGCVKAFGRRHTTTARARMNLATILAAQDKWAEAIAEAAEASGALAEVSRSLLAGTPESHHATFIAEWAPRAQMYIRLAAAKPDQLGKTAPAVWAAVMDWKATSGRALLDRLEALTVGEAPEAGETYKEVRTHRRSLVQDVMRGPGAEGVEKYNVRLEKVRERVEELERTLAQQVKGYSAVAKTREATPTEVARRLPPGSVLLEFVRLDALYAPLGLPKGLSAEAAYVALVVVPKPDGGEPDVKVVPLGPAKDVDETIKDWANWVQKGKRDRVVEGKLRERVWDPVAKVIPPDTKRLFVAPGGELAVIPFEAIWDDDAFLVERYLISYCSTGRDLIPRPAPPGQPGVSAVVADPDFNHAGFVAGTPVPKGPRPTGVSALAFANNPPLENRLTGFAVEADAVTKLLGAKLPGAPKSFRRVDATEENVQSIVRPRVLYFITHGNFLQDQQALVAMEGRPVAGLPPAQGETAPLGTTFGEDPRLRSFLCLTGYNHWRERAARGLSDGLLTAREVGEMDLWGTDLVVMAACKTGVGEVHIGEGVMGLRRAFQQAGARTVVTSLWSVDDGGTAALMPRFLGHYLAGVPKAEALRKAQLETIAELRAAEAKTKPKKQNQAAPFAWAAFICHGLPE